MTSTDLPGESCSPARRGPVLVVAAGDHTFDAYPFILLKLLLSCLAAVQGAILLTAAKRADQVTSELAAHDDEVNQRTEKKNTELTLVIENLAESIHRRVVVAEPAAANASVGAAARRVVHSTNGGAA